MLVARYELGSLASAVDEAVAELVSIDAVSRLWARDASLFGEHLACRLRHAREPHRDELFEDRGLAASGRAGDHEAAVHTLTGMG